jgi:hypothetical protein
MALAQYINHVLASITNQDGDKFASLISLKNTIAGRGNHQLENAAERSTLEPACKKLNEWADVVISILYAMLAVKNKQYVDAYSYYQEAIGFFHTRLREESIWDLPVLYAMDYDLRAIATMADRELVSQGQKAAKLEDSANTIRKLYAVTIGDRSPLEYSKKLGALHLVNSLLRIYFKLKNLEPGKTLIKNVDNFLPQLYTSKLFPTHKVATYNFYLGRLLIFDGNYKKAQEALVYSFEKFPKRAWKNKRLILLYLIPIQAMFSKFPKPRLLQKYNLPQFADILTAVKQGDLRTFIASLSTYQDFFIKHGIYLMLEKLKTQVYRNLIKKIWLIRGNSMIPLSKVIVAVQWLGETIDMDEVECIVANLVFDGHIKGYISHQKSCLVLREKDPFPKKEN